jgi:hypothetical protein
MIKRFCLKFALRILPHNLLVVTYPIIDVHSREICPIISAMYTLNVPFRIQDTNHGEGVMQNIAQQD